MGLKWLWVCLLLVLRGYGEEPKALYLSLVHDPLHTMTIQWHTQKPCETMIYYGRGGEWKEAVGCSEEIVGASTWVHHVELTGLEAATRYAFRVGRGEKEYAFQTLPESLEQPLRFVVGGDVDAGEKGEVRAMHREVAAQDPDFVVLGGDIAYAKVKGGSNPAKEMLQWSRFFQRWTQEMVTSDGRLIPLVPVVGNHDVSRPKEGKELFLRLFKFPHSKLATRALHFGDYLSLVLLDSGHLVPIGGKQSTWLEKAFTKCGRWVFPIYHLAAYPSFYEWENEGATHIRKYWVPLFEKAGVKVAFEHDNHCYKRTFPLKEGKVDAEGIYFLGDGAWGVPLRTPKSKWYLAKIARISSYYLVTLDRKTAMIEPRTYQGELVEPPLVIQKAL